MRFEPSYLKLYRSGELERRMLALEAMLKECRLCPWHCATNRYKKPGAVCHAGYLPIVSSVCDHHGEEPVLSGSKGSGTVFFGKCNLRCVFCQNYQISQNRVYPANEEKDFQSIARQIVDVQNHFGVHNINFVSPSHFVPQMVRIIYQAVRLGLHVPVVYNSNAYDAVETLRLLEGIVDIYLPDLKYADDAYALKYSYAKNYRSVARNAIKEMYRQVGLLQTDRNGIARKGLLARHLILPNDLAGTKENLEWLASEISPQVSVSLMSQYYPAHRAAEFPLLSRKINFTEYLNAVDILEKLTLENGFAQQPEAPDYYRPDFLQAAHPFKKYE